MARFLWSGSRQVINADHVVRVRCPRDEIDARAVLFDGTEVTLSAGLEEIERQLRPVVAAEPGYTRLRCFSDALEESEPWIDRQPVLAWRIDHEGAWPVTLDDVDKGCVGEGVLLPDGRVIMRDMGKFASEEVWFAEMKDWAKDEAEAERALQRRRAAKSEVV